MLPGDVVKRSAPSTARGSVHTEFVRRGVVMLMLSTLGWSSFFSSQLTEQEASTLLRGRVIADCGSRLLVQFEESQRLVVVPGRLYAAGEVPVVGDFVLALPDTEPVVTRLLSRRSVLSRGAAGRATSQQILASNIDRVFIVHGLDAGVKPRRLERTLAAVYASNAEPVVVLTKIDLANNPSGAANEAAAIAQRVPVLLVSGKTGEGLDDLRALLAPGCTGVLIGPSGSGKSTLVNALVGYDLQATGQVRSSDQRGRHITTGRLLVMLPSGGVLVDGPGIRELKLWDAAGLGEAFDDVSVLAEKCRFRDCRHQGEPGCAVAAAVQAGSLPSSRIESLHKLEREVAVAEARKKGTAARVEKQRWRAIDKEKRRLQRRSYGKIEND